MKAVNVFKASVASRDLQSPIRQIASLVVFTSRSLACSRRRAASTSLSSFSASGNPPCKATTQATEDFAAAVSR